MAATTVVSDDSVTVVDAQANGDSFRHRISWSAIFSGALVATAVTFFLLALGSGLGLSLVSARHATTDTAVKFLTLGAVFFFAAQAFGFAAGGHVAGRLMGPVLENPREEEFLAGAHGLITWALAVVATAVMIYLAAIGTGSAAIGSAVLGTSGNAANTVPTATGYWVDRLFRPPAVATHAMLGWRDYAQNDTDTESDATPAPEQEPSPGTMLQPGTTTPHPAPSTQPIAKPAAPRAGVMLDEASTAPAPAVTTIPPTTSPAMGTGNLAGDKAEAGRILEVAMARGGALQPVDRVELAHLVAIDTGQTEDGAMRRVQNVEQQMRSSQIAAAETARKVTAYASLWTALALLFGSIVTVMSAISARWEDDRVTFGLLSRR
jgi:hypothetical protein